MLLPCLAHVVGDDRNSTLNAAFVTQSLEYPRGRLTPLLWRFLLSLQDCIDDRCKRFKLWTRWRLGALTAWWRQEPAHLVCRVPAQALNMRPPIGETLLQSGLNNLGKELEQHEERPANWQFNLGTTLMGACSRTRALQTLHLAYTGL